MVEGESLNQLIEQLQQLHLEQERILQALENIAVDQEPRADIEPVAGVVSSILSTPMIQANELDRAPASVIVVSTIQVNKRDRVPTSVPVAVPVPVNIEFHIGQCVYITNRITHVLVRRATEADRTAIVTHFTASHVGIRTINGFHTHQHPKNLHPL
jgi:hypothetical protein